MKAYITIDTKNGKNGEIISFKCVDVDNAIAWSKSYKDYIDIWKKKRNFSTVTLEVFDGLDKKYFSFL